MRRICAGLFISLDAVVSSPEQWGFQYLSDDVTRLIGDGIDQADAVLFGPASYRHFAQMWRHRTDDVPMAGFLNHSAKYVVSHAPDRVGALDWQPATLLRGGLVPELEQLRTLPGRNILVPASPRLVWSLLRLGLLDELNLVICPVVVGSGLRLFETTAGPVLLNLVSSCTFDNGAIAATYQPVRSSDQGERPPLHFPDQVGRN